MPAPPRFDVIGFVIAGLGLCVLELAIENLGRHLVPPAVEAGFFALAAATLWLYARHARRLDNPVLDLKLIRIATFRMSVLTGGFCRIGLGGIPFLLPLLFQIGFGLSAMQSGLLTFITSLGAMLMKTVAPWLLRTVGFRRLLAGNSLAVGVMTAGLAAFRADTPHWLILGYLLIFGFLRSVQFTNINVLGYADLTPAIMSKGTSIASVAQRLSMSFGVAVAASALAVVVGPDRPIAAGDFRWVFLLLALFPLASALGFLQLGAQDGAQVSGHGAVRGT